MDSTYRPWQHLKFHRMLLGLAVAPIPGAMVCLVAVLLIDRTIGDEPPSIAISVFSVVLADLWSILAGMIWLYLIARSRGGLGRRGCMTMGAICAFVLPSLAVYIIGSGFASFLREDLKYTLLLGLPALLLGALGGWIFWRISVRPAKPQEVAAVFD